MIQEAGPSTPVIVSGLTELPNAGDQVLRLDDLDRVPRRLPRSAQTHVAAERSSRLPDKVTLDTLFDTMKAGEIKTINLIIKGDVQGSVETLAKTVTDANTDEVKVRVIHCGGRRRSTRATWNWPMHPTTRSIIGFHVVPDEAARHDGRAAPRGNQAVSRHLRDL